MPQRDRIHDIVRQALIKDGWQITDDPYIIDYGDRIFYVDLGIATARHGSSILIGASSGNRHIAVEIKEFRGRSPMLDLEQAIGQYVLYRLLLERITPGREIYLAVPTLAYDEIFTQEIGRLVMDELRMKLLVVELETEEVAQWIPPPNTEKSSNR
jgi:hypothetical protein